MKQKIIISPMMCFLGLLLLFELCVRLPYVIYVKNTPETGVDTHLHFFSTQDPNSVIFVGLCIIIFAFFSCFMVSGIIGYKYTEPSLDFNFPNFPKSIYVYAIVFFGAAILSVKLLGYEALVDDISGKRSDLGDTFALWALLKMSNFCHFIAVIFFIRFQFTGSTLDRAYFWIAAIFLVIPTLVFSQRAILIGFGLELIYLQILTRRFNLTNLINTFAGLIPIILLISLLRAIDTPGDYSFTESLFLSLEKVIHSRYFFDFAKIGNVMLWASEQPWLGPITFAVFFEPFFGDQIIFYKDIGPIISEQVYLYRGQNGVTTGGLLEATLSFGVLGGIIVFTGMVAIFLYLEKSLFLNEKNKSGFLFLFKILIISKFPLFINSSFGAAIFQFVVEAVLLILLLSLMWMGSMFFRKPE